MLSPTPPLADTPPATRAARRGSFALLTSALAWLGLVFLSGCAASTAVHRGWDAERRQDYDAAVVEYTKAVRLKPNDTGARTALERAKLRASEDHFTKGRRLEATGKLEEALVEYQLAAELNPASSAIDQEL